jgi:SAM-dependent methyltransferase
MTWRRDAQRSVRTLGRATARLGAAALGAVLLVAAAPPRRDPFLPGPRRALDVPYLPTAPEVVRRMIQLAGVRSGDVVYDLGCGDGRIVIAAVSIPGVRGVCVEIDPARLRESRHNAEAAAVADSIEFVQGDLFEVPIADATVVMLYLLPDVNLRLRPRLQRELRPGARVVSHSFSMGDWKPRRIVEFGAPPDLDVLYLWVVGPRRPAATTRR